MNELFKSDPINQIANVRQLLSANKFYLNYLTQPAQGQMADS